MNLVSMTTQTTSQLMNTQCLEFGSAITEQCEKSVSLYSNHNGANKVYHVYLVNSGGDDWLVNYAHAAVGKALTTGTKTKAPVPYDKAAKVFDSLVKEKKNGSSHYVEGAPGTVYQQSVDSRALFGLFVQEPTPINYQQLRDLIDDPTWGFQIKANGENRLLRFTRDGTLQGGNKKGHVAPVPENWTVAANTTGHAFVANGEHVGDNFHAFDLLELDGNDLRALPQSSRYLRLAALLHGATDGPFKIIECVYDAIGKRQLVEFAQRHLLEGIVAKRSVAAYESGKGADSLKFVFREVATCIVVAHNDKRSVQVGLLDDHGILVPRGSVTIPANREVPEIGAHVDVQYMYDNGNSFEIPVYDPNHVSPRDDVDRGSCSLKQVTRHKPSDQFVPFNSSPATV